MNFQIKKIRIRPYNIFSIGDAGIVCLGYWDDNPVNLIPISSEDSAPLYLEITVVEKPIIAKGKEPFGREETVWSDGG